MDEHEEGEMHRQPLDSVILGLRGMLGGKVVPILENVLEPPHMENIDRSVQRTMFCSLLQPPRVFDMGALRRQSSHLEIARATVVSCATPHSI